MGLKAMRRDPVSKLALVRGDDLQHRGFPHYAKPWPHRHGLQHVQHAAHPDAADFLIVGKRKMNGRAEFALHRGMGEIEAAGNEALHVSRAATIVVATAGAQLKRIAAPVLPLDRHHIRMPRKRNPRLVLRTNGGPEIGLPAILIVNQRRGNPQAAEFFCHKINQRQIAVPADCGKRDKLLKIFKCRLHAPPVRRWIFCLQHRLMAYSNALD